MSWVKPLNMQWLKSKALKAGFRFESWSRVCSVWNLNLVNVEHDLDLAPNTVA